MKVEVLALIPIVIKTAVINNIKSIIKKNSRLGKRWKNLAMLSKGGLKKA